MENNNISSSFAGVIINEDYLHEEELENKYEEQPELKLKDDEDDFEKDYVKIVKVPIEALPSIDVNNNVNEQQQIMTESSLPSSSSLSEIIPSPSTSPTTPINMNDFKEEEISSSSDKEETIDNNLLLIQSTNPTISTTNEEVTNKQIENLTNVPITAQKEEEKEEEEDEERNEEQLSNQPKNNDIVSETNIFPDWVEIVLIPTSPKFSFFWNTSFITCCSLIYFSLTEMFVQI
ncbi:hypothetical protein ABK040_011152 [Willaertia magna]